MIVNSELKGKFCIGFTLLELVIVIVIVGAAISVLLPAVRSACEASRRTQCQSNLRQFGLGAQLYIDLYRKLPENRWFLDASNRALKESMWATQMLELMQPNADTVYKSPAWWICPSSQGLRALSPASPCMNCHEDSSMIVESRDYVACGGISSYRSIGSRLASVQERQGFAADVFQEHPVRQISSIRGGLSQTIACWESIGSRAVMRHPNYPTTPSYLEWPEIFDSGLLRSDLEPIRTVRMVNQGTAIRYTVSSAGRVIGYLAWLDNWFQVLEEPSTNQLSWSLINVSNLSGGPYSSHGSVLPVVFVGGETQFLSERVDSEVLLNLATIADDQPSRFD